MNHRLNQLIKHRRFKNTKSKIYSVMDRGYKKKEVDQVYAYFMFHWGQLELLYSHLYYPQRSFINKTDPLNKLNPALDTWIKEYEN